MPSGWHGFRVCISLNSFIFKVTYSKLKASVSKGMLKTCKYCCGLLKQETNGERRQGHNTSMNQGELKKIHHEINYHKQEYQGTLSD